MSHLGALRCYFVLWLAAHRKCWTSDRLAKRNLEHLERCPICDQEEETIDHVLVGCIFTREFRFLWLRRFCLQIFAPRPGHTSFMAWWEQVSGAARGLL